MYKYLRVALIGDVKRNAAGLEYRQVWFRPITQTATGETIFSNQDEKARTLFAAHDSFKADPLYDDIKNGNIKTGSLVEGSIQRFETTPYQPDGYTKPVTSATYVIFSNENGVSYANRQLRDNYSCVVDTSTGGLTNPQQLEKPLMMAETEVTEQK